MVATDFEKISMVGHWTDQRRHCMHLLATHYPTSTWPDRAAIYNLVCVDNRTPNQVRDEYGGHTAGRRNRQGGGKPTRSIRWNDEICRDEFGLAGPFNAQQQIDRGTILRDIQAAITSIGLNGNAGLGAVNLVAGMELANVALANSNTAGIPLSGPTAAAAPGPAPFLTGPAPATAPTRPGTSTSTTMPAPTIGPSLAGPLSSTTPAQAGTSSNTATVTATTGSSVTTANDDSDNESLVDPANGGAVYYHSREIQREGPSCHFVYREIPDLPYDDETLAATYPRRVRFPALGMQWVEVEVCAVGGCEVCGPWRSDSSEEEDGGEDDDPDA
jgi:hypothetical protein